MRSTVAIATMPGRSCFSESSGPPNRPGCESGNGVHRPWTEQLAGTELGVHPRVSERGGGVTHRRHLEPRRKREDPRVARAARAPDGVRWWTSSDAHAPVRSLHLFGLGSGRARPATPSRRLATTTSGASPARPRCSPSLAPHSGHAPPPARSLPRGRRRAARGGPDDVREGTRAGEVGGRAVGERHSELHRDRGAPFSAAARRHPAGGSSSNPRPASSRSPGRARRRPCSPVGGSRRLTSPPTGQAVGCFTRPVPPPAPS